MMQKWLREVEGCGLAACADGFGVTISPTSRALDRLGIDPLYVPIEHISILNDVPLWVRNIHDEANMKLVAAELRDATTATDVLGVPACEKDLTATELADDIATILADAPAVMRDEVERNVRQQRMWWRILQRGFAIDMKSLAAAQEEVARERSNSMRDVGVDLFNNFTAGKFLERLEVTAEPFEDGTVPSVLSHKMWSRAIVPDTASEQWGAFKLIRSRLDIVAKVAEIEKLASTGRAFSKWAVSGARTGRMSSREVQMQNIPARLRSIFRADPGHILLQCDLDRVEPTVAAWLSGDPDLRDALASGDLYERIAEQVGEISRADAKTTLLALLYGEGIASLAVGLNRSRDEAEMIRTDVLGAFPVLAKWSRKLVQKAKRSKGVTNGFGRIIRLKEWESYKAVNFVCQSTAAALLFDMVDEIADHPDLGEDSLWLAVHDEIILQVPLSPSGDYSRELRALKQCMTVELGDGIVATGTPVVLGETWVKN